MGGFGAIYFVNFLGDYEEQQREPREGELIFSSCLGSQKEFSRRILEIKRRERSNGG